MLPWPLEQCSSCFDESNNLFDRLVWHKSETGARRSIDYEIFHSVQLCFVASDNTIHVQSIFICVCSVIKIFRVIGVSRGLISCSNYTIIITFFRMVNWFRARLAYINGYAAKYTWNMACSHFGSFSFLRIASAFASNGFLNGCFCHSHYTNLLAHFILPSNPNHSINEHV